MRLTSIVSFCISIMLSTTAYGQKTVLVTGGLTGIGAEITKAFRDDGWEVYATSRNPEKHAAIEGVKARTLDVTNSSDIKNLFSEIKKDSKKIDVLVNNAAFVVVGPEEALTMEQARNVMAINVIGPLQMTQEALPIMRQNQGGHIINISSIAAINALPGMGIYSASKMALEGMSEALAAETVHWNIKVSVIEPGAVKGEAVQKAVDTAGLKDLPGYVTFTNQLRRNMTQYTKENGQSPTEVAQLTLKVAKNPNPNFRYQTSSYAQSVANAALIDPTGNTQRDIAAATARDLYDYRS